MSTQTQPDWKAIFDAFRVPFPPDIVKQREGKRGMKYDYIDARDVENRLDEVVGAGAWSDSYEVIDPARMGIRCRLTIHGVSKEGVGYPNSPVDAKDKNGKPMSDEPGKDAESDALKRAAVKWGIGRHLYEDSAAPVEQTAPAGQQAQASTNGAGNATNRADVRAPRTLLKGLAMDLAKARGKGETNMKILENGAANVGIEWKGFDALSEAEVIQIGKWTRTQLQLLKDGATQPAVAPAEPEPAEATGNLF